ncbi:MAG: phosphatase PAP2 family protein [Actinomycetota bacterium]|nr:phosphatase PAP2 family protein [Actinomycetota bacterium]
MKPPLIVLLCGLGAAFLVFVASASRRLHVDPIDTAVEQRAVRRSLLRHPRVRRFLRERVDRRTAGGFLLTVSFAVVFLVAIAVGWLLGLIREHSWLSNADKSLAKWGSEHGTSTTVDVLTSITQLGSSVVAISGLAIVGCLDYYRRHNAEVFAFFAVISVGQLLLANVLKWAVARERPAVLHLVKASGYSFPSGHSVTAAASMSAIALVLGAGTSRRARAALAAAAALVAVSVATSRALLGVHWLSDVIAGLLIGWGWFTIAAILFGGRVARLGDPVSVRPAGGTASGLSVPAEHRASAPGDG